MQRSTKVYGSSKSRHLFSARFVKFASGRLGRYLRTASHMSQIVLCLHSRFPPTSVALYERVIVPYNEQLIKPSSPTTMV